MSGLSRTPGKRVWVNSPPRVRIPPFPPYLNPKSLIDLGFFFFLKVSPPFSPPFPNAQVSVFPEVKTNRHPQCLQTRASLRIHSPQSGHLSCVLWLGSLVRSFRASTKMSVRRGLIRIDRKNHANPLLPLLPAMKATTKEKSIQNKKTSIAAPAYFSQ